MNLYAVRDAAANAFINIFILPTDEVAKRALGEAIKSDQSFRQHPADYALFKLGTWDQVSGVISPATQPLRIINFVELLPKEGA